MSTIIEQAIKGKRKAMELLYETNKQKVYYVSLLLLGNETEAAKATAFAFKNVWGSMTVHDLQTEADFQHLAICKAVDFCKKKTAKENPKAFRIPNNRNFWITRSNNTSDDGEKISAESLKLLPPLQRFIFVLHSVGEYPLEQIAGVFKFDMKTIGLALEAEQSNVDRVIGRSDKNKQTYGHVLEAVLNGEKEATVPSSVDESIAAVIDGIARPIEKKKKKRITLFSVILLSVCLLAVGIAAIVTWSSSDSSASLEEDTTISGVDEDEDDASDTSVISEPVIDLDESLTYYADIEIADYGTVTVALDQEAAPVTVANFVNLAQNGFYDGLTFYRIIEGFMMQGGDSNGGSGEYIVGEFTDNGYENSLSHTRGAISMARSDDYNSASSQFFIVQQDSTYLDGEYAVFGYVTEGMEIVDAVCEAAEPTDDNGTIESDAQPIITSITIRTEEA